MDAISLFESRLKDAGVWLNFPRLRGQLHRARGAGLETLLDYPRLAILVAALRATADIPGDVFEFGTFRGGSAGVISQNLPHGKRLHVCDSFEGMPDVSPEDNFHQAGDFSDTGVGRVSAGLARLGADFDGLSENGPARISFAHIDVDLYQSVIDCLEFSYPRMASGAVIILDDYGAPTCLGAKQAADEFFTGKPETIVRLSEPAYGCIVGGGNAFDLLAGYAPLFGRLIFRRRIS
jgi:O-methyltransferase